MPQSLVNVTAVQEAEIVSFSQQLRRYLAEMMMAYQEREWSAMQLMLALLTRQHVLIWGLPGTGKSGMARSLMSGLIGPTMNGTVPRVFYAQLGAGTVLEDIFGGLNVPEYQRTGNYVYKIDGYAATADLIVFDEFFDASPGLLRHLHKLFNERLFTNGPDEIVVPLHTGVVTTNRSPDEVMAIQRALNLDATVDRFMFQSEVDDIHDFDNMMRMHMNFVLGARFQGQMDFAALQRVAGIIQATNQFPDENYVRVYTQIVQDLRRANLWISGRRSGWATQVVEAGAVVLGRSKLYFDDLKTMAYVLAPGKDSDKYRQVMGVIEPIVEQAQAAYDEHVDETEQNLLDRIEGELKSLTQAAAYSGFKSDPMQIGNGLAELARLETELRRVHAALSGTEQKRQQLLRQVESLRSQMIPTAIQ